MYIAWESFCNELLIYLTKINCNFIADKIKLNTTASSTYITGVNCYYIYAIKCNFTANQIKFEQTFCILRAQLQKAKEMPA